LLNDTSRLVSDNYNNLLAATNQYHFTYDTIFLRHLEYALISNEVFNEFKDSLAMIDLTSKKDLIKDNILDGITVFFEFRSNNCGNSFYFRCPQKSDTSEFMIIKSIFFLMDHAFKTEKAKIYIKDLKRYFDLT